MESGCAIGYHRMPKPVDLFNYNLRGTVGYTLSYPCTPLELLLPGSQSTLNGSKCGSSPGQEYVVAVARFGNSDGGKMASEVRFFSRNGCQQRLGTKLDAHRIR